MAIRLQALALLNAHLDLYRRLQEIESEMSVCNTTDATDASATVGRSQPVDEFDDVFGVFDVAALQSLADIVENIHTKTTDSKRHETLSSVAAQASKLSHDFDQTLKFLSEALQLRFRQSGGIDALRDKEESSWFQAVNETSGRVAGVLVSSKRRTWTDMLRIFGPEAFWVVAGKDPYHYDNRERNVRFIAQAVTSDDDFARNYYDLVVRTALQAIVDRLFTDATSHGQQYRIAFKKIVTKLLLIKFPTSSIVVNVDANIVSKLVSAPSNGLLIFKGKLFNYWTNILLQDY
jgi:hypothetical protein